MSDASLPHCKTCKRVEYDCVCDPSSVKFDGEMIAGFPVKFEPLVLQPSAEKDPTPPDYLPGAAPDDLARPYWRCATLMDHPGCGAVWLKERRVACACGGYVARIETIPDLDAWLTL